MQKELDARLKALFEANKEQEALYSTVDGQVFFNDVDAHNHAQRTGEAFITHSRNGNALSADAGLIEQLETALREELDLHAETKAKLAESEEQILLLKEEFIEKLDALQGILDAKEKELAACAEKLKAQEVAKPENKK